jgi:hypothetical protein
MNGIHWDPKVTPPCYLCKTGLKPEAAAMVVVVDMMAAAEDEFPSRTAKMSAPISTAIIEYNANAAPATEDNNTLTDRRGRNGRSFLGHGAYG